MKKLRSVFPIVLLGLLTACGHAPAFKYDGSDSATVFTNSSTDKIKEARTITSISINPKDITLSPKSTEYFKVTAQYSDGSSEEIQEPTFSIQYKTKHMNYLQVDSEGTLQVTEIAQTGDSAAIMAIYEKQVAMATIRIENSLDNTVEPNSEGLLVVTNYEDTDVVVNKERNLPSDYVPSDLVKPNVPFSFTGENERRYLRKEAAEALEKLFEGADKDGIKIKGVSGYRSYGTQEAIFNNNVRLKGYEEANKYSAVPGQSEHQTGLAIDVSCAEVGYDLIEDFGETVQGKWLKENVSKYGFILRYPKGKEKITGYSYEPWHIRYVGVTMAQEIMEKEITLEEYFQ